MPGLARRVLPAVMLSGVAVTLAAAIALRKPERQIATPLAAPAAVALRDLDALVVTAPPIPLPTLAFQDADGQPHGLAEFRGRPVVLNLWATWCKPCITELPSLAALAHAESPDGIAVVPLSTDRGGVATVRKFLAAHAIDLPIRVDPEGASGEALHARGLPTTVLIDAAGRERARLEGAADWSTPAARTRILELTR